MWRLASFILNIRYGLLPRTELRITLTDYFYSPTSATPWGSVIPPWESNNS